MLCQVFVVLLPKTLLPVVHLYSPPIVFLTWTVIIFVVPPPTSLPPVLLGVPKADLSYHIRNLSLPLPIVGWVIITLSLLSISNCIQILKEQSLCTEIWEFILVPNDT